MKKLLILLCLFASIAHGEQVSKPVECFPVRKLFDMIQQKYDEKLFMIFDLEDKDVKIALTLNSSTKSWTLVEYSRTIGCIIGTGESYKMKSSGSYL